MHLCLQQRKEVHLPQRLVKICGLTDFRRSLVQADLLTPTAQRSACKTQMRMLPSGGWCL